MTPIKPPIHITQILLRLAILTLCLVFIIPITLIIGMLVLDHNLEETYHKKHTYEQYNQKKT